ncbi:uncharacterized protein MELLADRAFT_89014 [Melampsora larici-populina 98AG31]|uniref:Uncharacterized protein n=1 Tax=Melampsora larici-populina (strain 98AG31 / pathotype 3-4-7) TaxID=747676 RepID=F4R6N5_MELLP|nr:uncharacterized protein MELLADRAFT_89014 [Melampsora larici-populina 98AG31]EGG12430.1 hypothetical protein MELLADRAFT_89014 [Melampsora larici-populina 98AG31]
MSEPNRIEANLEKFNEHVRRTSVRLANRAGSVPPEDRSTVQMPDLPISTSGSTGTRSTTTARGRGRGRAKKSTVNTRANAAARSLAAAAATNATTTDDASANQQDPTSNPDTETDTINGESLSVERNKDATQPNSLIERDSVNVPETQNRSPARRNTVAGTNVSPPRGFHSWLKANGLMVTSAQGTSSSDTPNVSSNQRSTANRNTLPLHKQVNAVSGIIKSTSQTHTQPTDPKKSSSVKWVGIIDDAIDTPTSSPAVTSDTAVEKETKVICDDKGINTNGLVALSKYFDTRMTAVKGYIPLSIFNTHWLQQDLLQQSFRQLTAKEKLMDAYVGMNVPVEWKMSFGEWVVAFDLFVAYCRHYTHNDLANKLVIHKQNVLEIMKENMNWPMAFRYDIAIRTTVMTIRNANGNLANPARYNDFHPSFADMNPYATGGPKEHMNPITGEDLRSGSANHNANSSMMQGSSINNQPYHPNNHGFHQHNQNGGKPNARSWSHANGMVYNGPGSVNYQNTSEDRRNNGRNTRGRGRSGGWFNGGGGGRDPSPPARWSSDNPRRGEGGGSWRRDDRRDDRRNDERDYNKGTKPYGSNGKANL